MRKVFAILALFGLAFYRLPAHAEFPKADLSIGMYRIDAEVAATPDNREKGLMFRTAMAQNQGMIFVFPQLAKHCMWMRNTLLPLSVAFLDEHGVILNVEEMKPKTEVNHCAVQDSRFALEMNANWFKDRGFRPGTPVSGLERMKASY